MVGEGISLDLFSAHPLLIRGSLLVPLTPLKESSEGLVSKRAVGLRLAKGGLPLL